MPSNVVKTKADEKKWEKAKELAAEQGHKDEYDYIMGIYKKMKPDYFKKSSMASRVAREYMAAAGYSDYDYRKILEETDLSRREQDKIQSMSDSALLSSAREVIRDMNDLEDTRRDSPYGLDEEDWATLGWLNDKLVFMEMVAKERGLRFPRY